MAANSSSDIDQPMLMIVFEENNNTEYSNSIIAKIYLKEKILKEFILSYNNNRSIYIGDNYSIYRGDTALFLFIENHLKYDLNYTVESFKIHFTNLVSKYKSEWKKLPNGLYNYEKGKLTPFETKKKQAILEVHIQHYLRDSPMSDDNYMEFEIFVKTPNFSKMYSYAIYKKNEQKVFKILSVCVRNYAEMIEYIFQRHFPGILVSSIEGVIYQKVHFDNDPLIDFCYNDLKKTLSISGGTVFIPDVMDE